MAYARSDSISGPFERIVTVLQQVYIPNIFIPGSELNDRLTVFGGPGVAGIESLRIFDRWGEQLFNLLNFLPNDPVIG